jgi:biotin synthase
MIQQIKNQVLDGEQISKATALALCDAELEELCAAANEIREYFCGNAFDLCSIVNGKSGKCTEDCTYCAQSSHYRASVTSYPLLDGNTLLNEAAHNEEKGVLRYSVVTSGRGLSDDEFDSVCRSYQTIKERQNISLCASHGFLSPNQFARLKAVGVTRIHNNLETSRKFFPYVCTTHTYDDKIASIKMALKAGLDVCSGGIIGLGEAMKDRIELAFELKSLSIQSIPINILSPIKGTPLENNTVLTEDEIRRTVAMFRFILPRAALRLAGGRGLLRDKGRSIFAAGANAAITGDMLTTSGIQIDDDIAMVTKMGFEVKPL